jgi:hypothetical protein
MVLNVSNPVQNYYSNLTNSASNRTQPTSFTQSVEYVATNEDLEEILEEKLDREPKTVSAKNLEMDSEIDLAVSSEGTAEEGSEIVSEVFSEPNSESDSQSVSEMVCKEYSDAGYNFRYFRCESSVFRVGTVPIHSPNAELVNTIPKRGGIIAATPLGNTDIALFIAYIIERTS